MISVDSSYQNPRARIRKQLAKRKGIKMNQSVSSRTPRNFVDHTLVVNGERKKHGVWLKEYYLKEIARLESEIKQQQIDNDQLHQLVAGLE